MEMGRGYEDFDGTTARRGIIPLALKAIILDFDGVILESNAIKDRAFKAVYRKYPQQLKKIMAYHSSHPTTIRFAKFEYIAKNILGQEYTKSEAEKLRRDFAEFVFSEIRQCPFVTGAREFLNYFHGKIPLYIVSINPYRELQDIMQTRRLKKYFKKVYCDPWRKRDALKDILKREGIFGKEAIFIGDQQGDYTAAKKAGVLFIGRGRKTFRGLKVKAFKNLLLVRNFFLSNGFLSRRNLCSTSRTRRGGPILEHKHESN